MAFHKKLLGAATGGLVGDDVFGLDLLGKQAAADATAASLAGSNQALAENRRQFDLTREDFSPFLEQATGEGGALEQFISGIDQAPETPQLQEFQFDPNTVLDNPNFQFIRGQGNIAADRSAGRNRLLGSGQRLIDAQNFGQGLASRFIGEEFDRGLTLNNQGNRRLISQNALETQRFSDRLNRLGGLVDTGRGAAGSLAQAGGQTSGNIANLLAGQGETRAAGILGQNAGIQNLLNTGLTAGGFILGGPAGGAAAGALSPFGRQQTPSPFSPIGAGDARGFFG